MADYEITSAVVSVAGGIAGAEGVWRLERKNSTEQIMKELDKLLDSCKFFDIQEENDLLMKYGQDVRKTVVSITTADGNRHAVTVGGHGDSSNIKELIAFIKSHETGSAWLDPLGRI